MGLLDWTQDGDYLRGRYSGMLYSIADSSRHSNIKEGTFIVLRDIEEDVNLLADENDVGYLDSKGRMVCPPTMYCVHGACEEMKFPSIDAAKEIAEQDLDMLLDAYDGGRYGRQD